jgi:hypothetical protein
MKKTSFGMIRRLVFLGAAFGILAGCSGIKPLPPNATIRDAAYYQANPMNARQVKQDWGTPLAVMALNQDISQWIYPLRSAPVSGYQYFLICDGDVLVSGVWLTDVAI